MDWTATRTESSPEPNMMDVDMDDAPDTVATIPQEGDVALSRPGGANHMAPIFDAAFPHGDRRDFLGPGPGLVQPSAHVGVHGSWQPTLAHPSPSRAEISFPPAHEQVAGRHVGQPPGHGSAAPAAVGTGLTSNNVVMPQWPAPAEAGAPTLGMHECMISGVVRQRFMAQMCGYCGRKG
ncbi:hypothetical protein BC826DRAFT_1029867 [Russula brevipes]|nr:hypothetical protein BC826DRAFT_1029867 [Russula brevipes]